MRELWFQDLEGLEAINQDEGTREVILRMAGLARGGRLGRFADAVGGDPDLDPHTKAWLCELAKDESLLLAVEDYLATCRRLH